MMQETETTLGNRTLKLTALRSFATICETGSFRRAAALLAKSPSAVSLQIAGLEEMLETRLFERDARRVVLTEGGETLLRQARQLLRLNDETVALFRREALSGRLTLAAPHDLGVSMVPALLQRLAEAHPDLRVDVRLGASADVLAAVQGRTVNLALFNDVGSPDLPSREVSGEPLVWLMLDGGGAVHRNPLPIATAEIGCAWRVAALAGLDAQRRDYRIAYASDTSMGQLAALRADLAIAALPRSLATRDLVEVPPEHGLPKLPRTLVRIADDGSDLAKAAASLVFDLRFLDAKHAAA
ncbi:LysR family transcriptional regulator [Salipiger bermudensis]|uniref:LysR family transcriptional regulator n=1 Tax=Salipiger bermudensis TaxID=344736 RepID=UPI001CD36326|nr:LysR family transcriptional regulator [Salipiger bermudensis]MCA0964905.1 LysR family transcriptional regulator [Salipiger bermudensis]